MSRAQPQRREFRIPLDTVTHEGNNLEGHTPTPSLPRVGTSANRINEPSSSWRTRIDDLWREIAEREIAQVKLVRRFKPWDFAGNRVQEAVEHLAFDSRHLSAGVSIPSFSLLNDAKNDLAAADAAFRADDLLETRTQERKARRTLTYFDNLTAEYQRRSAQGSRALDKFAETSALVPGAVVSFTNPAVGAGLTALGGGSMHFALESRKAEQDPRPIRVMELLAESGAIAVSEGVVVFSLQKLWPLLHTTLPESIGGAISDKILARIGSTLGYGGPLPRDVLTGGTRALIDAVVVSSILYSSFRVALDRIFHDTELTFGEFRQAMTRSFLEFAMMDLASFGIFRGLSRLSSPPLRDLAKEIPWYSNEQLLPSKVAEIRDRLAAKVDSVFPPDYAALYKGELDYRIAHPNAEPEIVADAVLGNDNSLLRRIRNELHGAISRGLFEGKTEPEARANEVLQQIHEVLTGGRSHSLTERNKLVETYLNAIEYPRKYDNPPADHSPPAFHPREHFGIPMGNDGGALGIPLVAVSGPHSLSWQPDSAIGPNKLITADERGWSALAFANHDRHHHDDVKKSFRSSLTQRLIMDERSVDFKDAFDKLLHDQLPERGMRLSEREKQLLDKVYYVIYHEKTVAPLPEHMLAYCENRLFRDHVVDSGKTIFQELGVKVSQREMHSAVEQFMAFTKAYLSTLRDGTRRRLHGQFVHQVAERAHRNGAVSRALDDICKSVESAYPSLEAFQLFLSNPANFSRWIQHDVEVDGFRNFVFWVNEFAARHSSIMIKRATPAVHGP